jgi:catechol 2,3-dioxygenase-like lactoylglutathione lyase family enzyme
MQFGFDHLHLVGSDLDASERFYREMFGAETLGRRDTGGAANLMMRLDGINLFIRSPRPTEQVTADGKEVRYAYDHFGVVVQDLRAAIDELRAKGVVILEEPRTVQPGTLIDAQCPVKPALGAAQGCEPGQSRGTGRSLRARRNRPGCPAPCERRPLPAAVVIRDPVQRAPIRPRRRHPQTDGPAGA